MTNDSKCVRNRLKEFKIIEEFPIILPNENGEFFFYIEKPMF